MPKSLVWCLLPLLWVVKTSASIVKRDPVSWSLEQCRNNSYLSGMGVTVPAPLECGRISVPLDYGDTTKGTINLQLARIPASQQPSRGGIFLNDMSGTLLLLSSGDEWVQKFGADWDLISWDLRGTGNSDLVLQQLTTAERGEIWNGTLGPGEFENHGNLTTDADATFFRSQASIIDSALEKFDETFRNKNGANLTYIGTTANVRDIVTMADALYGSDKDINFYGNGYITYMGYMLTQMFPNRIGKVILDGVVNPQANSQYLPILGLDEQLADVPQILEGFYNTCAQSGPIKCPVAAQHPTPEGIKTVMGQFLDAIYEQFTSENSYNMAVRDLIYSHLYSPRNWELLGHILAPVTNIPSNLPPESKKDLKRRQNNSRNSNVGYSLSGYTGIAIACSDTVETALNIVTTERVFEETIRISRNAPLASSLPGFAQYCHRYTPRAVERYSGPWNIQPKNVVLIIGNQADPVTPFRNAQFIANLLGPKARLVQQAGYGHTSLAMESTCTANIIKQYLQGTIPEDKSNDGPDVVCEVDIGPFDLPGNTPWNITTSKNGDQYTSGPTDPGLANFPGINPPPLEVVSNSQSSAIIGSRFGWWLAVLASFGVSLLMA
ncbi:hypothetical protein CPB86DRAFT_787528 [Serendipita vermifera]|nr:hypothetical protein CPB86DRAFT_787528 [Serendipita vermifera]